MKFEPRQLAAIDGAGYNGIRDSHIDKLCEALCAAKVTEVDQATFEYPCHRNGINPANFTRDDLSELQRRLSERIV